MEFRVGIGGIVCGINSFDALLYCVELMFKCTVWGMESTFFHEESLVLHLAVIQFPFQILDNSFKL